MDDEEGDAKGNIESEYPSLWDLLLEDPGREEIDG